MNTFKLQPVDILVNVNDRNDPFSTIKRWAVGPYEHVFKSIHLPCSFLSPVDRSV